MPKATLQFSLPKEREEHEMAVNAGKYYSALWDISQRLRKTRKYDEPPLEEKEFYEMLDARGISLDE